MSIELHLVDSNRRDSPVVRHVDEDGLLGMNSCLGGCGVGEL